MFEDLKEKVRQWLKPLTLFFKKFHPNFLTVFGFLITCVSGVFYAKGIFWLGGVILLLGGIFDVLDGEVAKLGNKGSKFGAFLDSTLDRYSDFVVLFGMFLFYSRSLINQTPTPVILVILTIVGSYMVSYTRARAEGLGIECKVGFGERAIRIPIIIIGSFFGYKIFIYFLWLLAILTNLTAFQRMCYVWKKTGGKNG